MIREISSEDIPWGLSLANRRYEERFDPGAALIAIAQAMKLPSALAIRSDHGFLVANIIAPGWYPDKRDCQVLWLCMEEGYHWEAVKLLRASICWAKEQGCKRWWVASETEFGVGALAQRVGAKAVPRYGIDFEEEDADGQRL